MPTRTDIAVPIGQRTDRLPDQQTHRPPKAQAICKSPIPPQPAKAPHAPGASLSDRSPAPAPARARARFLPLNHAWVSLSAVSATPPASPSSRCPILPIGSVAASEFPPPATDDRPHAAAYRTAEPTGTRRSAPPALGTSRSCCRLGPPEPAGPYRSGSTPHIPPGDTLLPQSFRREGLPTSMPVHIPQSLAAAPSMTTTAKSWPPWFPASACSRTPRTTNSRPGSASLPF